MPTGKPVSKKRFAFYSLALLWKNVILLIFIVMLFSQEHKTLQTTICLEIRVSKTTQIALCRQRLRNLKTVIVDVPTQYNAIILVLAACSL